MPTTETIFSSTNDGRILKSDADWSTARDADSGTAASGLSTDAYAVRSSVASGRGGTTYYVARSFFEFDVSSITHVPKSASCYIHGYNLGAADMRLVQSNQSASLANGDFDAIVGWDGSSSDGSGAGTNVSNVTLYDNAEISSWDTAIYNTITLSQQALVHIAGLSIFKCCLIEADNDLRDVSANGPDNRSGMYFADTSGTSRDPKLVVITQDDAVFMGANF